jgi:hypothetical protein
MDSRQPLTIEQITDRSRRKGPNMIELPCFCNVFDCQSLHIVSHSKMHLLYMNSFDVREGDFRFFTDPIAQLVERLPSVKKVARSNPTQIEKKNPDMLFICIQ